MSVVSRNMLRGFVLLVWLASLFPIQHPAQAATPLPPVDLFQLPWDQGLAWYAIDGFDDGSDRPAGSSHNYNNGGAVDFAPRLNMVTGADTSNAWVAAAADGVVSDASFCFVRITHAGGWTTEYQFLANVTVKKGDVVARNQRLGILADGVKYPYCPGYQEPNTPHVHFTLRPTMVGATFAGWKFKYSAFFNATTFEKDGKLVSLYKPLLNVMPGQSTPTPAPVTATPTPDVAATATALAQPTNTLDPFASATPTPFGGVTTNTPDLFATATAQAQATPTPDLFASATALAQPTNTLDPFASATPTPFGGVTNTPDLSATATAQAQATSTSNPFPSLTPDVFATATALAQATNTPNPFPSLTPDVFATATAQAQATNTPDPFASSTPTPFGFPSNTPDPFASATPTPFGQVTNTPDVFATATPDPFASPTPFGQFTNTPDVFATATALAQPTSTLDPFASSTPTPFGQLTSTPDVFATATALAQATNTPDLFATATALAQPTNTLAAASPTPSNTGPYVSTTLDLTTLTVGASTLATVRLHNVPVDGYSSAEFTCTFDPALVEVSDITVANLFGADSAVALNVPQNGTFILAVAGANGNKAFSDGIVFTFNVHALAPGETIIDCPARASQNRTLTLLPSTRPVLTILALAPTLTAFPTATAGFSTPLPVNTPTAIPSVNGALSGQVLALKPVTINIFSSDAALFASLPVSPDGTFTVTLPVGTYTVIASANGYLSAQGLFTVEAGTTSLPVITLPAGDIDGNNVIDNFDAMTIGMSYNTSTPANADLNNDGLINVLDLELLARNYRLVGPVLWQ